MMSRWSTRVAVPLCRSLWAACSVTLVVGCGDSGGGSTGPAPDLVVASVRVTPTADTLDALGITSQFTATAANASGGPLAGKSFTWTSSDTEVATVSATGLATATGNGTTTISAAVDGMTGSATLVVAQKAASLTLQPANDTLVAYDDTLRLTATVLDGQTQPIISPTVTWVSSDTLVARVDSTGLVTAVSNGSTSVAATAGAATDTATVTVAQVAASVSVVPAANTLVSLGDTVALAATVADARGNPIVSATVTWASSAAAVATVSATGVVTAVANGTSSVSAAFNALADTAAVTVAQVPTMISVSAGNSQSAVVSTATAVAPAVRVDDARANGVPGVVVLFDVRTGDGSATGITQTTDAAGLATVGNWTVGPTAGSNTLTATASGAGITGNPVTFTATGVTTLFDIVVRYSEGTLPSDVQRAAFTNAANFWRAAITGDLANVLVNAPTGTFCGATTPAVNETVDDLLIYVEFLNIDGVGNVLASAGPCVFRTTGGLPAMGGMKFDNADLASLSSTDLEITIRHEMAHVLGVGTVWSTFGFLELPSDPDEGGTAGNDTHFDGPEAIAAFNEIGGTNYVGNKVPVENDNATFSTGSLDGHWRESVFQTELMTPLLNSGVANLVSKVTIASFKDLGYIVNTAAAENYVLVLPGPARALRRQGTVRLLNDIWRAPIIYMVGDDGTVVRVLRR